MVVEGLPDLEIVVDRNRVVDPPGLDRPTHVVEVVLEPELGRVYADGHQSLIAVSLRPGAVVRLRAQPIDTGVGPELDHDLVGGH